jgi:hypothetical protein
MALWSFERVGFLLGLENGRNPVHIDPSRIPGRISVPGFEFDDSFICPDQTRKEIASRNASRKSTLTNRASLASAWRPLSSQQPGSVLCVTTKKMGKLDERTFILKRSEF